MILPLNPLLYYGMIDVSMKELLRNKKATFNYQVIDSVIAGVSLLGIEVKSLKQQHGSFEGAYITESGGDLWLKGFFIPPYQPNNTPPSYDPYRLRKILVTKDEIHDLAEQRKSGGLTLIPTAIFLDKNRIRIEIALARGKKKHDKRETIKKRDIEREIGRKLKS